MTTSVHHIPGLQWGNWHTSWRFLAARYRPGDRIYMFGYSRGAFAVRSLSGIIDRVGLLRSEFATTRYVDLVWQRYSGSRRSEDFKSRYCHGDVNINMMGIDDTLSTLKEGRETNIGWLYKQLGQSTMTNSVHHIPGLQWGN